MVVLGALAALVVEEADEVQHRTVLEQVQLGGTCCGGSISDASALTGPRMSQRHGCARGIPGVPED